MFCAGCGSQIQSGLNYCSRCGRRVAEDAQSASSATSPMMIAGYVAGVGFICFIFILRMLTRSDAPPNLFVPITFFYFAALFGICFLLLRHGASLAKNISSAERNETREPEYLRPANTAQLEEARDFGIGSVTDATTRTLDKVPIRDDRG